MRQVVILNHHLSSWQRGQVVPVDELGMTDVQIDGFIAAGHAVEVVRDGDAEAAVSGWPTPATGPTPAATTRSTADVDADTVLADDDSADYDVDRPGRNESRLRWERYAEPLGIDTDGLTRDEIIAEVDRLLGDE